MPAVPTYDQFQATPAPLPDSRVADVQPGNAALQVGHALDQAGAELTDSAIRLQHQQNADRVFQAEAVIKNQYLQFEAQSKQREGQNAWGVANDVGNWWVDKTKTIGEGLENDAQRAIFAKTIEPLRYQSLNTFSQFESQQRRVSTEQSANASIQGSIDMAAATPSTDNVDQARGDILRRVQVLTDVNGWTPEIRTAQTAAYMTKLHSQVIGSLVDKNPDVAAAYLDAHRDEIEGSQLDQLDKAVHAGTIAVTSQNAAQAIVGQGLNESEALTQARSKFTGATQDEVVRRVLERYAERHALREQDQKDAADSAWGVYARDGYSTSQIPGSVLARMDGKMLASLRDDEAARLSGKDVKTNWETFQGLKVLAAEQPDAFAKVDLRTYFGQLGADERKGMIDLQEQIKRPDGRNDVATIENQLRQAHELLAFGNSPSGIEQAGRFDSAAMMSIQAETNRLKRKLSFDERQEIVDRMMLPGELNTGIFRVVKPGDNPVSDILSGVFGIGPNRRYYQVVNTPDAKDFAPNKADITNVPPAERAKIQDALQRHNMPVTDDAILGLWLKKAMAADQQH